MKRLKRMGTGTLSFFHLPKLLRRSCWLCCEWMCYVKRSHVHLGDIECEHTQGRLEIKSLLRTMTLVWIHHLSALCLSVFLHRDLKFSLLFMNMKSCHHILLISAVNSTHTEMWVTHQHKCFRGWQVEELDEHLQKKYLGLFKDHINSTKWGR